MQRPRLKSVFPPMPIDDRTIAIGGADYGLAAELQDDDSRHLWQLLGLLDGSRTASELVAELRRRRPGVPAEDVEAAIEALAEAGYVEDAATDALPRSVRPSWSATAATSSSSRSSPATPRPATTCRRVSRARESRSSA